MSKITVSFHCDTPDEAREILRAAEKLTSLPYRLNGFGTALVKDAPPEVEVPATEPRSELAQAQLLRTPAEPRKNVSPGKSLITKIGTNTTEKILRLLAQNKPLKGYEEHLKLLWARKFVRYDGEEYYLP